MHSAGVIAASSSAVVMDHTITVGSQVLVKTTTFGFGDENNFNYGSIDTVAVPWASNRNIATINWNTAGGLNIMISGGAGNSGWTSLEFYDGSSLVMTRSRSGMTYSQLGSGVNSFDFWQIYSGSPNPFGTTVGATRFLKWNY